MNPAMSEASSPMPSRRPWRLWRVLLLLLPLLPAVPLLQAMVAPPLGFDDIAEQARTLALSPYRTPASILPAELRDLREDDYAQISLRPGHALWQHEKLPFELSPFHPGPFQAQPVRIHELNGAVHRLVRFKPSDFDYGSAPLSPQAWGDIGFAGFQVRAADDEGENSDNPPSPLLVMGATYFRALGTGQHYGSSAGGLALDVVDGPGGDAARFTDFWVERPAAEARTLVIYALMDSPTASGAYQFIVHPGAETMVEVHVRLFPRGAVQALALAPLTSMVLSPTEGMRRSSHPGQAHNADGLMIAQAGGEWIWHPLSNPGEPLTASFPAGSLRGFGLMQRNRDPASYAPAETGYETRPSSWIEPLQDWGPGEVQLLQLPTQDAASDNVVAYWAPAQLPAAGQALDYRYRLHQQTRMQKLPPGWVAHARSDTAAAAQGDARATARTVSTAEPMLPDERHYTIEFEGPALAMLPAGVSPVARITCGAGARVSESRTYRNPATGNWQLSLRVQRLRHAGMTELRAFLAHERQVLTETWSAVLPAS